MEAVIERFPQCWTLTIGAGFHRGKQNRRDHSPNQGVYDRPQPTVGADLVPIALNLCYHEFDQDISRKVGHGGDNNEDRGRSGDDAPYVSVYRSKTPARRAGKPFGIHLFGLGLATCFHYVDGLVQLVLVQLEMKFLVFGVNGFMSENQKN